MKIFYSSPFRSDKNIGKAYNEFIELLPEDAYVCITDGDSMFLHPYYGKCIEEIIKTNPDYDLIGCVTNRLGILHQCYNNEFSEDTDVSNHYEKTISAWDNNGTIVEPTNLVAGLCMIFSKQTWIKVGGFKENTIFADKLFSQYILRNKGKIGIAKGLYVFHGYRIWNKTHLKAWNSTEHLR